MDEFQNVHITTDDANVTRALFAKPFKPLIPQKPITISRLHPPVYMQAGRQAGYPPLQAFCRERSILYPITLTQVPEQHGTSITGGKKIALVQTQQ